MSHRGDLTERLAVLPVMLAEKPHTQRELAEHFNVAPRTIRRSVDELSRYHPITIERIGREVRYRLGGNQIFRSPLLIYFDPDGATLKLIGYDHYRRCIIPFAIDHIHVLEELDERFRRPSGFNLREYLTANCFNGIHGAPVRVVLKAYGVTARVFAERSFHPSQRVIERVDVLKPGERSRLAQAGKETRSASFEGQYVKQSDMSQRNQESDVQLTGTGDSLGVAFMQVGRKQSQVAKRVVRASRRRANTFTSERGAKASSKWDANSLSSDLERPYEAALDWQESTTIELTVAGGRGLMRFILGWGADVEVLEPESLRREVAMAHRQALERY